MLCCYVYLDRWQAFVKDQKQKEVSLCYPHHHFPDSSRNLHLQHILLLWSNLVWTYQLLQWTCNRRNSTVKNRVQRTNDNSSLCWICAYPSTGSKTTMRGGHSPLSTILLHKFKVSVSSFDKTWVKRYTNSHQLQI